MSDRLQIYGVFRVLYSMSSPNDSEHLRVVLFTDLPFSNFPYILKSHEDVISIRITCSFLSFPIYKFPNFSFFLLLGFSLLYFFN